MTSAATDTSDLPCTMPALLRRQAAVHGDRVFMVVDDERLTYAEAESRSRVLARGLLASGVTKGTHVALLQPNGADFVVGMLAAMRIGAVLVPLSTFSTAEELRWLLANSDSSFLLAAAAYRSRRYDEALATALPELDFSKPPPVRSLTAPWLRRIWFSGAPESPNPGGSRHPGWSLADLEASAAAVDDATLSAVEQRVSPADRLIIIHTSGSTSTPKAVIHTHGALIGHYDDINRLRGSDMNEIMYAPSPWFWVAGFSAMFGAFIAGGRMVSSNAVAASDVLDVLERERPTNTVGFWSMVERLAADPSFARRDLSSIRRGNLYPVMAREVQPRDMDLRHGNYGSSEAGGTLTFSGDESDQPESRRGSFGKLTPGLEARIVDPETGKVCGAGELGELWVRGPRFMEGYYGKPRHEVFDADGWWHSGDLGCFDADGFFYFRARRGDMIKTSGANVAPREVEAVLRAITGGLPCFVLGVPDPRRGQLVTALIVSNREADVDEAALRKKLGEKLSTYKVPRRIIRLAEAELPLLSNGKVDMRRLAALAKERVAAEV
ncbi:MAG TPA: class I adenylate-forming enzyme family protein [Burkholderiales bacterium]|nr:class I adenylate-forming enzyme family protein [Burkholderiales bacterium]